jgi:hypothetical protein
MENPNTITATPVLIAKEDINQYTFVSYDVLDTAEERASRKLDLERAMVLGNGEQVKIAIIFMTNDGLKRVETTVWAATEDSISLKGGIVLPVNCIKEIRFV